jgi:hypothetical protein
MHTSKYSMSREIWKILQNFWSLNKAQPRYWYLPRTRSAAAGRRASHVTTRTFGPFSAGLGPAAPHGPLVPRIRSDKAAARHGRRGHVTVRRTGPQRFGWAGAGPDFPARDEDDPPMTMTHRCERLTCPPRPRLTTFSIYLPRVLALVLSTSTRLVSSSLPRYVTHRPGWIIVTPQLGSSKQLANAFCHDMLSVGHANHVS